LFEFAFAFAYRYQQRNGCPISLFLCKIIASATFGCRRSFKTADSCSTASCIFLFTEGKMEDPFLKIRGKVCGEWLAPPPVVARNLNFPAQNLLHSVHYLLATCSIFPLICYILMLVLLESTTRFWQDVAQASLRVGLAFQGPEGRPSHYYLSSSTRQKLTHGVRVFSRISIFEKLLFFP